MHIAPIPDTTAVRLTFDPSPDSLRLMSRASSVMPFPRSPRRLHDGSYELISRHSQMALYRLSELGCTFDPALAAYVEAARQFIAQKSAAHTADPGYMQRRCGLTHTPWNHQAAAIHCGIEGDSVYYAMGMGTGKSLVTVGVLQGNRHGRSLILCPHSVLGVWPREFNRHGDGSIKAVVPAGQTSERKLEYAHDVYHSSVNGVAIVMNYDMFRSRKVADWAAKQKWDCVVLDEAHRTKSPTGVTAKAAHRLWECSGQRLCLSGTPMPHSPLDLWSQLRFLDPGVLGTSFVRFRARYAKLGFFKNVEELINQDELAELFNLVAFRVDESVVKLPPVMHSYRTFKMGSDTRKSYHSLRTQLAAEIEGGLVTASNALVKSLRLQQITSGFYHDENTGKDVDLGDSGKADALREVIEDSERPIVVCCRYTHDLDVVQKIAASLGLTYGELSGRRSDMLPDATMPPDMDVFGVNIASGGVGIDLTRAANAVLYSLNYSAGDYDQFLARLHRHGQNSHVSFTHLIAEGTIDEDLYAAIRDKRNLQAAILDSIRKA